VTTRFFNLILNFDFKLLDPRVDKRMRMKSHNEDTTWRKWPTSHS